MKNQIIFVLLFTTFSLSFAQAEVKSDNFSEEQFNQIEHLKQQALKSELA